MAKMIQIRHVPDEVHAVMKARAAAEGMSLSDYLKREVTRLAERPTVREWRARVESREPVEGDFDVAQIIREEREERERRLDRP